MSSPRTASSTSCSGWPHNESSPASPHLLTCFCNTTRVVTPYDLLVIPLDIHKNVVRRGDAIVEHIALSNDDLDVVLTLGNMDILLALLADRTQHRLSEHWHL